MGVLDSYTTVGEETTYGTQASVLTRGFETFSDPAKRSQEYMQSAGMRAGLEGPRANRRRKIDLGAAGPLEVDLADRGLGILFKAMMGTFALETTPDDKQVFSTNAAGPATSLSMQACRGVVGTGVIAKTHLGGMCTGWEIMQKTGGEDSFGKLKLDMDYQEERGDVAAVTPVYPDVEWVYGWDDCTIEVDGSVVEGLDLTVNGGNGLKTDVRYLRGSTLKDKPYRESVPTHGGSFSSPYKNDTLYDLYTGADVVEFVVTWAHPSDAARKIVITMPEVQFIGDTPVVQPGSSTQSAPFVALDPDASPKVTLEYFTPDVTY